MPTYSNTGTAAHSTLIGYLWPGTTGFVTTERLDDLAGVVRTADTPYIHEPREIAADNTMTPWVKTPAGTHTLLLRGDWVGQVSIQVALEADGSDATLAGEFVNGIDMQVQVFELPAECYLRLGFLAGDYVSGTLYSNVQVGGAS